MATKLVDSSLADGSKVTYATAGRKFLQFWNLLSGEKVTSFHQLPHQAAAEVMATAFVAWLSEYEELAPSSIRTYSMAVRTLFRRVGNPPLFHWKQSLADLAHDGAARVHADRLRDTDQR